MLFASKLVSFSTNNFSEQPQQHHHMEAVLRVCCQASPHACCLNVLETGLHHLNLGLQTRDSSPHEPCKVDVLRNCTSYNAKFKQTRSRDH